MSVDRLCLLVCFLERETNRGQYSTKIFFCLSLLCMLGRIFVYSFAK